MSSIKKKAQQKGMEVILEVIGLGRMANDDLSKQAKEITNCHNKLHAEHNKDQKRILVLQSQYDRLGQTVEAVRNENAELRYRNEHLTALHEGSIVGRPTIRRGNATLKYVAEIEEMWANERSSSFVQRYIANKFPKVWQHADSIEELEDAIGYISDFVDVLDKHNEWDRKVLQLIAACYGNIITELLHGGVQPKEQQSAGAALRAKTDQKMKEAQDFSTHTGRNQPINIDDLGMTASLKRMELKRRVFEALGTASMCWSDRPIGIFQADEAEKVGKDLVTFILNTYEQPSENDIKIDEYIDKETDENTKAAANIEVNTDTSHALETKDLENRDVLKGSAPVSWLQDNVSSATGTQQDNEHLQP